MDASLVATPTITTIHGFSSERILPVYRAFNGRAHFISVSKSDQCPELAYVATIPHGIDLAEFTYKPTPDGYLLFFGRIHPDKGAGDAVRVARTLGQQLVLAGPIQDRGYFEQEVEPYLDNRIRYAGSVGPAHRNELLGGATCLLHLIHFDEPFGLSVIEAMACGTPVIAYARGSMPELIADGVSGFLVEDEGEVLGAVSRLPDLDRVVVRRHAELFSVDRMVNAYLAAYRKILLKTGPRHMSDGVMLGQLEAER